MRWNLNVKCLIFRLIIFQADDRFAPSQPNRFFSGPLFIVAPGCVFSGHGWTLV
jgi:hypothetical protein